MFLVEKLVHKSWFLVKRNCSQTIVCSRMSSSQIAFLGNEALFTTVFWQGSSSQTVFFCGTCSRTLYFGKLYLFINIVFFAKMLFTSSVSFAKTIVYTLVFKIKSVCSQHTETNTFCSHKCCSQPYFSQQWRTYVHKCLVSEPNHPPSKTQQWHTSFFGVWNKEELRT